ncbi:DNA repair protein RAD51 homolog 2 isoform X2 [Juglans regia]|uniref:DNA repair protein RAD51 homolog 2 isoform X2 n=1 Tax=Juglans regia TaxID=51240 RepID=A0A6P9E041_JUGRE|nr:DNA repair protein RAD51 homolog 2 isoform X2 [Juglans regia]
MIMQDALSLTEFQLMELLDVGWAEVTSAVAHISAIVCPPYQSALSLMEQRVKNEHLAGHLPTGLKGLDEALCGGIPFGVLTELVGPAGIGKTQFCLKLSLLASLPSSYGGLDGHVIYIDVESKFSSRRLIEIGAKSFPEIFLMKGMAKKMSGRILVWRPASLSEFTERLQQIKVSLHQNEVKLLVIDSMAALVSGFSRFGSIFKEIKSTISLALPIVFPKSLPLPSIANFTDWAHSRECEQGIPRQHPLGWHVSFIKSLAEFSRIPIVVTNQVRSQSSDEACQFSFQVQRWKETKEDHARYGSHLVAALGVHWAHAVTIRLVLEAKSGQRFLKVSKSPISAPLAFPFDITASGMSLLSDDGIELTGPDINAIHSQGHSDIINFTGESLQ